jgi:hypothetical protein
MTLSAEKQFRHVGETKCIADHDHDLVHALSDRLDAVWRYDQYIANAEDKPELQEFWREVKEQDVRTINRLRELIGKENEHDCF